MFSKQVSPVHFLDHPCRLHCLFKNSLGTLGILLVLQALPLSLLGQLPQDVVAQSLQLQLLIVDLLMVDVQKGLNLLLPGNRPQLVPEPLHLVHKRVAPPPHVVFLAPQLRHPALESIQRRRVDARRPHVHPLVALAQLVESQLGFGDQATPLLGPLPGLAHQRGDALAHRLGALGHLPDHRLASDALQHRVQVVGVLGVQGHHRFPSHHLAGFDLPHAPHLVGKLRLVPQ
mmetsp:Transcript_43842/g.83715  ORF Transcript_43842/g.83715 Transcript_43842/m.83715 type:complete len:231 (-) Transcript_43842:2036-2728(-)